MKISKKSQLSKYFSVSGIRHFYNSTSDLNYIQKTFGDVKFVCMGGSRGRVISLAKLAFDELKSDYDIDPAAPTTDLAKKAGR